MRLDARRIIILLFVLFVLVGTAVLVSAQEVTTPPPVRTVTDDEVNAIAEKLYCPVCENITLDTCGTAACADWRYEIRLQLEAGMSEQEIIEDFVHRFGDRVVGTPLDPVLRGLSLFTPWIVIAAALIGAAVVFARRRSAVTAPVVAANATPSNRYQDLFEQDAASD